MPGHISNSEGEESLWFGSLLHLDDLCIRTFHGTVHVVSYLMNNMT